MSGSFVGVHQTDVQELTPEEVITVDARQDELMAIESVAGRPPAHWLRRFEWRSVAVGLPILILCAGAWAMFRGVTIGAIVGFGIAACLLMLLGGWPVLAAGLLREKEETRARAEAIAELHSRRPSEPG